MSELIGLYNEVAEVLRSQRSDLYQRELLLDTILQGSPIAVVLANPADRVVFANVAARDLLGGGKRFDGRRFSDVAAELPPAMREILQTGEESIFSVGSGDHDETFHYVRRTFYLNTRGTPDADRAADAGAAATGARGLEARHPDDQPRAEQLPRADQLALPLRARTAGARAEWHRLDEIYATIGERLTTCALPRLLRRVRAPADSRGRRRTRWRDCSMTCSRSSRSASKPAPSHAGNVDRAQIEQVVINLVKNAAEAGSSAEEIVVDMQRPPEGARSRVSDRG